jgi:S-DNA-T family DNA segregation ATPase FtsK/SpoIIIE
VPVLGVLAPVGFSLALWAITGSALSLVFAALGPVVLLAGIVDGRLRLRRSRRRNGRGYAERLNALGRSIDDAHDAERRSYDDEVGSVRQWLADPDWELRRWSTTAEEPVLVSLGRAEVPSRLRLIPAPTGPESPAVEAMRVRARTLPDGPLVADLRHGLGILGSGVAADALLRAVLLQAMSRMPPGSAVDAPADAEEWLDVLPHAVSRRLPRGVYGIADGGVRARVARVDPSESGAESLRSCETIVDVAAGTGTVVRHPDVDPRLPFRPEVVAGAEAFRHAECLARDARGAGTPGRVALRSLLPSPMCSPPTNGRGPGSGLRCALGVGRDGVVEVDLVRDGPHAVIGGMTGSGKSELLLSWVLALAAGHPPSAVTFLLLDFKGGATFSALEALPHTVGVLTDLQPDAVRRVVDSVAAELRFRERSLAAAGLRSIDDGPSELARLVLVIDEFAALAERLPECHALLTDVAARGRSLGVHLVLCTQRPAGVVRDALLANAGLRICLRVTSAEDSRAVVGTADAVRLRSPGSAVLTVPTADPLTFQVAEADAELAGEVAASSEPTRVRRPWLPELPPVLDQASLPAGAGLVLGLADLPEEQAQPAASWDPPAQPSLLVLGAPRSGKSTALAAIAAAWGERSGAPPLWPRATLPCVWDAVEDALGWLEPERPPSGRSAAALLLLDDVDAVLASAGSEHAQELAARLLRVLREGPAHGVAVALGAVRLPPVLASAGSLIASRLLLRAASREEHVLAGGTPALFDPRTPPGRGTLDGIRVQVALASQRDPLLPERVEALQQLGGLVAVSTRPAPLEAVLTARGADVRRLEPAATAGLDIYGGNGAAVLLGTPDDWQSRWGLLKQLAAARPVLLDGCSPADLRSLLGSTEPPPPCSGRPLWLVRPGESAVRVTVEPAEPA